MHSIWIYMNLYTFMMIHSGLLKIYFH
uniref:Uncharacterized protein n=1 Tax=Heterorhabditis bacteriophora TaxID=37862 RepID=A0A1I7WZB0_HETBA